MTISPCDRDPAGFRPLTPLAFLHRAAAVFPDRPATVDAAPRRTRRDFHAGSRLAGSARFKRPRHIVSAEIPKAPTGKAPKFAPREPARMIGGPPR